MKIKDLRNPVLIKEHLRLKKQDVKNMLKHKSDFVEVPCPACNSESSHKKFLKEGFRFVECPKCNTLFISPRPNPEQLSAYYRSAKSTKFWADRIFPQSEKYRQDNIFRKRVEITLEFYKKYGSSRNLAVDVGAGSGIYVELLKRTCFFKRNVAVELSESSSKICRDKGLETISCPAEEMSLDRIDLLTAFEFIEHLFSPREFLSACRNKISTNALLVMTTPNILGFDLLLLGPLSRNISGPAHLNYFNPGSLQILLSECGFNLLETSTPGKLDAELVRNAILENGTKIQADPFLKMILIDKWEEHGSAFQQFLSSNKLSSHLWTVARKA